MRINTRSSITENTINADKSKNLHTTTAASALQKRVPFSDISNASAFQRPTIQHTKKSALAQPALKQTQPQIAQRQPLAIVNKVQSKPAIIKPATRPLSNIQEAQTAKTQSRPHSLHVVPTSLTLSMPVEAQQHSTEGIII